MKKLIKIVIIGLIIVSSGKEWVRIAVAEDIKVECEDQKCYPTQVSNRLSWDNIAPGKSRSFAIKIVNKHNFVTKASLGLEWEENKKKNGIKFKISQGSTLLYEGYLTQAVTLNLGKIKPTQSQTVDLVLTADNQLGDDWQGVKLKFKTNLYIEEVVTKPNNQPTPTPTFHLSKSKSVIKNQAQADQISTNLNLGQVLGKQSNQNISSTSTRRGRKFKWLGLGVGGSLIIGWMVYKARLMIWAWLKRIRST